MKKKKINLKLYEMFLIRKKIIIGILISLILEAAISLGLPGILSKVIDGLENHTITWLISFVLFFLLLVIIKGFATTLNSYLSEKMGRSICDEIRKSIFEKIFSLSVAQHKMSKTGDYFEKIEGDANILVGFFSNMLIDIVSSSLMVLGILIVFMSKSIILGGIFFVIAVLIFALFLGTQNKISSLWNDARKCETDLFGEFSEIMYAAADIKGLGKEDYANSRFEKKFEDFEHKQVKASFLGNLPSTIFFSLLNVGESIALIIGVNMLSKGMLSIGEVYLLISYVGLLNMPFYHLKYQFTQMPLALAALQRINSIFDLDSSESYEERSAVFTDNNIEFSNVSFGYDNSIVLSKVSFKIGSNENVLIKGRTGCGKSTILHLIAGLYSPNSGSVMIGGIDTRNLNRKKYMDKIFYISQFYPVIEDTLLNNLVCFNNNYDKERIENVLHKTGLDKWMKKNKIELNDIIKPEMFSEDESQILAWTAALISNPRILLVDEFDASIKDNILELIDKLLVDEFNNSTIIMVSHKNRSSLSFQRVIHVEENSVTIETFE